ncbi:DNA-processing protein DprA [Nesterenkonia alba]|uniref:DNA-processing protein DprA n=1 Tax=Nesterenkonia alba TaxID=515814 RepID=UPI0003B7175A|nr:DNA-processing protein DprA [Nesterenkonia alba]
MTEQVRLVRAELSRLIEPGDALGHLLVDQLGPVQAHQLIVSGSAEDQLSHRMSEAAAAAGLGPRQRNLAAGLQRWRTRLHQAAGERDLEVIERLGGGLLIPEDPGWPQALDDLGLQRPIALWFRTTETAASPQHIVARLPATHRSIAVVGAREMTDYGGRVTAELGEDLAARGVCIVSGGAYGVDGAAHRSALRAGRACSSTTESVPTLAVLAGGLDRFYPAGHEDLLRRVATEGLLLAEMAPGASPSRHRFLIRNRLIAALTAGTVVVEARWRSGALSTAHHALALGRPLGAVPGPVTSPSSAGCHRLLKETPAQLVTDAADVMQMVAAATEPMLPLAGADGTESPAQNALDQVSELDRRIYDALPARRLTTVEKLSSVAGLPVPQLLAGLTRLQRAGLARRINSSWGREHYSAGYGHIGK